MVSLSSYNFLYAFQCVSKFLLSYLQVKGHLETLAWIKFYGSGHDRDDF